MASSASANCPCGTRFHAHAPLFAHHVAFFIELAKHRIVEALRLQQKPQFQAIAREVVKVIGGVFAGSRIQSHAAVGLDQLGIRIRDHIAVGLFHGGFELLLKIVQRLLVGLQALIALGIVLVVDVFHFVHGLALERIILGADGFGPFERHVLEHMRDPGLAARIVHRPGVDIGVEGDHRRLMALENDEMQSVAERKLGDPLLKIFQ